MIRKTSEGFAIEIDCSNGPANEYVEITNGLVELLQAQDKELDSGNQSVLLLLKEMLPTYDQAVCMFETVN